VGPRGIRVQNIVSELGGEKIDIIKYDKIPEHFIANSLSPSKVDRVYINEEDKIATVVVPDYQLSLAIGKEGQNARLAAKLTGWKVDIKSASQFMEENASNLVWPALEDKSVDESLGDGVDSHSDQLGEETDDHGEENA
jgi:transcription antitermination factor NusA-like protein